MQNPLPSCYNFLPVTAARSPGRVPLSPAPGQANSVQLVPVDRRGFRQWRKCNTPIPPSTASAVCPNPERQRVGGLSVPRLPRSGVGRRKARGGPAVPNPKRKRGAVHSVEGKPPPVARAPGSDGNAGAARGRYVGTPSASERAIPRHSSGLLSPCHTTDPADAGF